eukprot:m.94534 g.94534  ORF g.94534 m.94534 type:complete len:584 (-) comp13450_c0_seq1:51-1802(-)
MSGPQRVSSLGNNLSRSTSVGTDGIPVPSDWCEEERSSSFYAEDNDDIQVPMEMWESLSGEDASQKKPVVSTTIPTILDVCMTGSSAAVVLLAVANMLLLTGSGASLAWRGVESSTFAPSYWLGFASDSTNGTTEANNTGTFKNNPNLADTKTCVGIENGTCGSKNTTTDEHCEAGNEECMSKLGNKYVEINTSQSNTSTMTDKEKNITYTKILEQMVDFAFLCEAFSSLLQLAMDTSTHQQRSVTEIVTFLSQEWAPFIAQILGTLDLVPYLIFIGMLSAESLPQATILGIRAARMSLMLFSCQSYFSPSQVNKHVAGFTFAEILALGAVASFEILDSFYFGLLFLTVLSTGACVLVWKLSVSGTEDVFHVSAPPSPARSFSGSDHSLNEVMTNKGASLDTRWAHVVQQRLVSCVRKSRPFVTVASRVNGGVEFLQALCALLRGKEYAAGTTIREAGVPGDAIIFLLSGTVTVTDHDGMKKSVVGPSILGDNAVISWKPYFKEKLDAKTACVAMELLANDVEDLKKEFPAFERCVRLASHFESRTFHRNFVHKITMQALKCCAILASSFFGCIALVVLLKRY